MGVYIKGLKLPSEQRQGELLILTSDGRCVDVFSKEYQAVEVPPHGRLIDADAFTKDECNSCDGACETILCGCLKCKMDCRCEFMKDIADAPTIIEEEIEI